MSSIDDLIADMCPDGVDFRTLGDLGFVFGGLTGKSKADFSGGNRRYISYINILKNMSVSMIDEARVTVGEDERQRALHKGDVLFTGSSETSEEVAMSSVVTTEVEEPVYLNSFSIGYRLHDTSILDSHFAKHLFRSTGMRQQLIRTASGVTRFNVSKSRLVKVRIPVPPLEVQREIVRILDHFAELEAELEVELKAELEARRRQYAYYRDNLLNSTNGTSGARIDELCKVSRGRVISKVYLRDNAGSFPVYSSQTQNGGIFGYIDNFDYDFESLTWTTDGANAGSVFFHQDERFSITNVCGLLRVKDPCRISTRYLYYQLNRHAKTYVSAGMGNPKLMANAMSMISIPVPSLKNQEYVVEVLDNFDALVNDLSVGLPAELAARRKQYAYYRDRLLTFEELPA